MSGDHEGLADRILRHLRDFQRVSAENAFARLYTNHDPVHRFLIADEVGMGKTHVAKGLIALSIDHLRRTRPDERIDIIYICSNQLIAAQNISRLNISGNAKAAHAARITLLPLHLPEIERQSAETGINFMSFTPGTSLTLGGSLGVKKERALLYLLARRAWNFGRGVRPKYVFQGSAGSSWTNYVDAFENEAEIHEGIASRFANSIAADIDLNKEFEILCEHFPTWKSSPAKEIMSRRSAFIGELRKRLAEICIDRLQPELVIVDEFQRFKHILDADSDDADLARRLFNFKGVKTVLVSATPYKMCTFDEEESDENHYEDFLRTIKFLANGDGLTSDLRAKLGAFRTSLTSWPNVDKSVVRNLKQEIEAALRMHMSRVERVGLTERLDAMIKTIPRPMVPDVDECRRFVSFRNIADATESGGSVEYWKAAPYLMTMMEGYEIRRNFDAMRETPSLAESLEPLARELSETSVKIADLCRFKPLDPANARMKLLFDQYLREQNSWRLLWIPPSLPYYQPSGVYADPSSTNVTKALVFSSWRMVPRSVATLCSYEAERLMLGERASKIGYKADFPSQRLVYKTDDYDSFSVVALRYPCRTLIERYDPIALGNGGLRSLQDCLQEVASDLRMLFESSGILRLAPTEGRVDNRWYLVACLLLDRSHSRESYMAWQEDMKADLDEDSDDGLLTSKGFRHQIAHALELIRSECEGLERLPPDLYDVLALIAVAGPGTIAGRAVAKLDDTSDIKSQIESAEIIAIAFQSIFNRSEAVGVLDQIGEDEPYWKRVLHYIASGNGQAMLDEYLHLLWETTPESEEEPRRSVCVALAAHRSMTMRTVVHKLHEVTSPLQGDASEALPVRCRFALAYGDWDLEGEKDQVRAEVVRDAFNSPFHPFILATTSVGQEGLDFHFYSHAIFHWNLPRNPVDLEQREGRINRYKGHVVRKNVAAQHKLSEDALKKDPWAVLFHTASLARPEGAPELEPFWICRDPKFWIERHVPLLPMSREEAEFRRLKKTIGLYRVAFGQPRHEDLLSHLEANVSEDELNEFLKEVMIDLRPRLKSGA